MSDGFYMNLEKPCVFTKELVGTEVTEEEDVSLQCDASRSDSPGSGTKMGRASGILPNITSGSQGVKPSLSFTGQKKETVTDVSVRLEQPKVVQLLLSRVRTFGVMVWVLALSPE